MFTVYLIVNKLNGKMYVGKTKRTLKARWQQHLSFARQGRLAAISCAIRKYNAENFTVSVLQNTDDPTTLNRLECIWIFLLDSRVGRRGYNMTSGGDGGGEASKGIKRSPETLIRMSAASGRARRDVPTEKVIDLYLEGKSANQISDILNLSRTCIYDRLQNAGIPRRPRRKKEKVIRKTVPRKDKNSSNYNHSINTEEIVSLYEGGKTTRQIAKILGVEKTLVIKRLESVGVPLRLNPRDARKARLIAEGKEQFLEIDDKELAQLYNSGYTTEEIAVKFELTHVAVRNRLIKEGVTFRHGGKRLKEEWPKHQI